MSHERFDEASEIESRRALWRTIVASYLQDVVACGPQARLLDVGSGWGEFVNAIAGPRRLAIDFTPSFARFVSPAVAFSAQDMRRLAFAPGSFDVLFASNVLEHLPTRDEVLQALRGFHHVLRPGGRLIVMQPNFKYCTRTYFDFFDHYSAYTELSMAEGLRLAGFAVERVTPRFLPYSTKSRLPQWTWLVRLYLHLPIAWRIFGQQFLIVARKPPTAGQAAA
jgi:2-polyprenyl-3-methyl-5-hydroxy-6-metoxy-1,4-benzoquinol methylase